MKLSKPDGSKHKTVSSQELMGGFVLVTFKIVQANISEDNAFYEIDIDSPGNGNEYQCNGQACFPVSPETVVRENGVSYVLSKSFVHDIGLTLSARVTADVPVDVPANDGTVKCHHCDARLKVKDMRVHVGRHILNKTLTIPHSVSTCGYCGRQNCVSTLVVSSRRGQQQYYKVESDCSYKVQASKNKSTFSVRNKCTNTVLQCPICHKSMWKYNLPLHVAEEHTGMNMPTDDNFIVSEEEKKTLCKGRK